MLYLVPTTDAELIPVEEQEPPLQPVQEPMEQQEQQELEDHPAGVPQQDPQLQQPPQPLEPLQPLEPQQEDTQDELDTGPTDQSTDEQGTQTRGPRTKQINLPRHVEGDLVEWLQEHEYLYSKQHEDHKNKDKKQRTYEEKGRQMNPPMTGEEVRRWVHSRRTQYGRLTKRLDKSGSGKPNLSENDRWLLRMFKFFKPHIQRQRETTSLGVPPVVSKQIFQLLFYIVVSQNLLFIYLLSTLSKCNVYKLLPFS